MNNLVKKGIIIITVFVAGITGFNIFSEKNQGSGNKKNSVNVAGTPEAVQNNVKESSLPELSSSLCKEQDIIKDIIADEIKNIIVKADPPGKKVKLTREEIIEFTGFVNNVILYERTGCYSETSGQMVTFNITKTDGTKIELIEINPFFVVDGQGFFTEYKPCEIINQFAIVQCDGLKLIFKHALVLERKIYMPLKIIRNDITKVRADIIVNSANPKPVYANGTDVAIYEAAGKEQLLAERQKIGDISVGNIAVTPDFSLNAKYIIHTVGPGWQGGDAGEFGLLNSCYSKSLGKAMELNAESIAFPLISTGVYQFPRDKALQTAVMSISEFLFKCEMLVILVVFDRKSFELSGKLFQDVHEYIDECDVADQAIHEYQYNRMAEGYRMAVSRMMPDNINGREDKSLNDIIENIGETFQERLLKLISQKGMSDPEVYKKANIDRKLFSKIRCDVNYTPRKKTVLALAVALELNIEDTTDLLKHAGLSFSPGNKFDLITEYFIKRRVYNINTINLALFEHGQQTLGI